MKNEHLFFRETTSSTNAELQRMVSDNLLIINNPKDFFALYADFQTAGRGMKDSRWESAAGENLLLSFYFTPPVLPCELVYFNFFFTTSIYRLVAGLLPEKVVRIKFPNDIYVENRKIAGILIEPALSNNRVNSVIAGTGLNINQAQFSTWLPNPTSLYRESGCRFNIRTLIDELICIIEQFYSQLLNKEFETVYRHYHQALYQLNSYHRYRIGVQTIEAKIVGVSPLGKLHLIEKGSEREYFCGVKEVCFC
ncbi:MAG: biotin--[acetyl-CoA-carboxylase] ligase [Bacteroidales bacterium]|jgi:BirA family biotin operon repressor/biotin-[acetyl-CoA-carboxylase] ligase|nr:biotin--[acetyl-CoA-carboxylase] ligase [Bacteroidales bacterium]